RGSRCRVPLEQRLDVGARDADAVLEAQQVLQEYFEGVGKSGDFVLRQRRETPDLIRAIARLEGRACPETVRHACLHEAPASISGAPWPCWFESGGSAVAER